MIGVGGKRLQSSTPTVDVFRAVMAPIDFVSNNNIKPTSFFIIHKF